MINKLIYMTVVAALAASPIAMAQAQSASVNAEAAVTASTTAPRPIFPKIGPAVKDLVEQRKDAIKNTASTTNANVKARIEATQGAVRDFVAEKRLLIEQRFMQKKADVRARAEVAKEKARERGAHVEKIVKNMVERLSAMTERLANIAERLEVRIEKLKADGKAMTQSTALLAEANVKIDAAADAAGSVSVALETALASDTPREAMADVRAAVTNAHEALRTARQALEEVVRSIKLEAGVSVQATTTSSN